MTSTRTLTTDRLSPPPLAGADALEVEAAIERACARIAPTWPLDRFIAVNPLWGWTERPLPEVAAELAALSGARLLMPRAYYREAHEAGRLRREHLRAAIAEAGADTTEDELLALLRCDEAPVAARARVMDVADAGRDLARSPSWREFVVDSTSQLCAAFFDEGQARVGPPFEGGLYATWRAHARADHAAALVMGEPALQELARDLPGDPRVMARVALPALGVPEAEREAYLTSLLLDLNGWAAWCAYRRWTARLDGRDDDAIVDLLGIRLAWEWLLLRAGGPERARAWRAAIARWPTVDAAARAARPRDWLLQRGLELAWQGDVSGRLRAVGRVAPAATRPAVQAVFCIDVRSEVLRRALEAEAPAVVTLGFAGFFRLPLEYQPLAAAGARPQLPGLLAPRVRVTDAGAAPTVGARRAERLEVAAAWKGFQAGAASCFGFVEAAGLSYAWRLASSALRLGRPCPPPERAGLAPGEHEARRPRLTAAAGGGPLAPEARVELAAGMLRAMSLTRGLARLVVLVGHGSQTVNNPHAAGLDCGACCGQTGEVNARAAAALLNEPAVRAGLAARGVAVPEDTVFVAGLHDTTTDEVRLFDTDELPASHALDLAALRPGLAAAGDRARRERAARLGLDPGDDARRLRAAVERRAREWSQVRPEWGLADNAAFIVAPRARTRGLDLRGQVFLHEYRHELDEGFATLELIMTAPMVVTHWINFQYYASTVDNARFGSGNKVLHDVVGGHLGVFEGNGGDLRIGLPLQSLHDGARWVHTPRRLSVFIEAPRAAIDGVLAKHAGVRAHVEGGWLHLLQLDPDGALHARRDGGWSPLASATPTEGGQGL